MTVDELISYPNWTTPLPVHIESIKGFLSSVIGSMNEQVEITVAHLHFMAHCRRLAALIRVACLWLEAWDQPGTSVMFFVFFKRAEGSDSKMFSTEIWLSQKINSLLNLPFIIFDRLDPIFFVFVS